MISLESGEFFIWKEDYFLVVNEEQKPLMAGLALVLPELNADVLMNSIRLSKSSG